MTEMRFINVAAMTHAGVVRPDNQDSIVVGQWLNSTPMQAPRTFQLTVHESALCLVADGMGGHAAGAEASRRVGEFLRRRAPQLILAQGVDATLKDANAVLFRAASEHTEWAGMGTTVAGMVFGSDGATWFNVGDSRIFRYRDKFLMQLSSDDVPINDAQFGRSHRITQAIGGSGTFCDVEPHIGHEPFHRGWQYLICSDGLTDMLDINDMELILVEHAGSNAVFRLFQAAIEAGGADNISIMLISCSEEGNPEGGENDS